MHITLTVNGAKITIPDGASVLDAVNASSTYISQLCKDPDMKPIGACRTCLVQIEGQRGFPASCSTPARDGMVVSTETADVRRIRRVVLELTLAMVRPEAASGRVGEVSPSPSPSPIMGEGPTPSPSPEGGGSERERLVGSGDGGPSTGSGRADYATADFRELTAAARHHDLVAPRWAPRQREPIDTSSPVFNIDMSACIMCGRCAQGCQDGHQFIGAIDVLGAGQHARIGTFDNKPLVESICTTCGTCLSVCPTGAIHTKEQAALPLSAMDTEETRLNRGARA